VSVARFGGLTLACMLPSLQLPRTFVTTLAGKALMTVRRGASVGPLWLIILSADKESFPQDRYRRSGQSDFRRHPGEPRHEERIRGRCRKSRQLAATETGEVQ
jgi:hypothetical protein